MAAKIPLARIGAYPQIPPGTPGWYWQWCLFEGISPYHPERMTPEQKARYEEAAGEPAPPRNPYRSDKCHPMRIGHSATTEEAPWREYPGGTIAEKCVAWLQAEFSGRHRA